MNKFLIAELPIYLLIAILVTVVAMTTHPLGFNNYGYDYGFYSYAALHAPLDSLAYFTGQDNHYGNHLFVISKLLQLPQIATLNFLFLLFFIIAAVLFYEIIKKNGHLATVVGVTLFIFSIAQSQLYTMYLWKAAYGQVLLLLIFLLIQQKKQYWEFIPLIVLFISHKTSSIMALASLVPSYIFGEKKQKLIALGVIILSGLIFLYGLSGLDHIKQLLDSDVQDGLFFETFHYLKYSWYLIPLASYGVYESIKSKKNLPWLGMLGISLIFIIFEIAFFQRLILYADLSLIFFSSIALGTLRKKKYLQIAFSTLLLILSVTSFIQFSNKNNKPLISDEEITEIQNFSVTHQGTFILSLSAQDGPWLLANLSGNIRLAAPGMFEDKYSKELWQAFWEKPNNEQFLEAYPKPLYLYERAVIFYQEPWNCLTKVSPHFYKYICKE